MSVQLFRNYTNRWEYTTICKIDNNIITRCSSFITHYWKKNNVSMVNYYFKSHSTCVYVLCNIMRELRWMTKQTWSNTTTSVADKGTNIIMQYISNVCTYSGVSRYAFFNSEDEWSCTCHCYNVIVHLTYCCECTNPCLLCHSSWSSYEQVVFVTQPLRIHERHTGQL